MVAAVASQLLFFMLAWPSSLAARRSVEHGARQPSYPHPSEERLRSLLQQLLKPRSSAAAGILINRHNETSVFEQTRYQFEDMNWSSVDGFDGKVHGFSIDGFYADWTGLPEDFAVKFQGEEGTDFGGLRKEWLQDVLESIVISKEAKEEEQGLDCIRGKHDCVNGPQYLLELLPSGTLIPIMSSTLIRQEQEPKEKEQGWTGWVRSKISEFMDYLKEPLLSPAQKRYRFLGKWIAKAYVVSGIGYSPYSFHPKIYERLLWGQEVTIPEKFYSEEDTIPVCEELAQIYERRSPAEMDGYGWQNCNEVKDPVSKRYTQEGCYKPIYRDASTWEYLYLEWGPLAHLASSPKKVDDLVSFTDAKEYTKLRCEAVLKQFAEPVKEIAKGFQEVLQIENGSFSFFWDEVERTPSRLKQLIEGNPEVSVDEILESANWEGEWTKKRKLVFQDVLVQLKKDGAGEHTTSKKPLNKLLRFFTGSFSAPVGGFQKNIKDKQMGSLTIKSVYDWRGTKVCEPLQGHTCFNSLDIPEACLDDYDLLYNIVLESMVNVGFGYD